MRALRSVTATLGLSSLHQEPRVGGTLRGAPRDGSDGWRSPGPPGRQSWAFFSFSRQPSMPSGVDSVRDGRSCTFGRFHFPVCSLRRCGVFVASCCGSSKKASTQRGVAGSLFLGSKKQRVDNIVTDTWLATAGLRGGQILEESSSTCSASNSLLPSASAAPQGPEVRDVPFHVLGLRFVVPRICGVPVASCCGSGKSSDVVASSLLTVVAAARVSVYAVSGGTRKYFFISSSLHRPFGGLLPASGGEVG